MIHSTKIAKVAKFPIPSPKALGPIMEDLREIL